MSQRPRTVTARRRLLRAVAMLDTDELAVLTLIATRLAQGRDTYGTLHLERDRRDFEHEALEELADALVYVGAALVQRTRGRRRPDREAARG
jgi:hypothetical protein